MCDFRPHSMAAKATHHKHRNSQQTRRKTCSWTTRTILTRAAPQHRQQVTSNSHSRRLTHTSSKRTEPSPRSSVTSVSAPLAPISSRSSTKWRLHPLLPKILPKVLALQLQVKTNHQRRLPPNRNPSQRRHLPRRVAFSPSARRCNSR